MKRLDFNEIANKFNRAKLTNYISTPIELGFSTYGPTVGVAGVLQALDKVILVQDLLLCIRRLSDGQQYLYSWLAFRPPETALDSHVGLDLETPRKFMVVRDRAHPYSILFADQDNYSYLKSIVKNIAEKWKGSLKTTQESFEELYARLIAQSYFEIDTKELEDLFYWQEGAYQLSVIAETDNPKKFLEVRKDFALSAADCEKLKTNLPLVTMEACQQPHTRYIYVYPTVSEHAKA